MARSSSAYLRDLSHYVQGKFFALILLSSAFFYAILFFPETSGQFFQASVLVNTAAQTVHPENLELIDNFIRIVSFLMATCGTSLLIMTMLLKLEAKRQTIHINSDSKIWKIMSEIPSVSVVETLIFLWVLCSLVISFLLTIKVFDGRMDLLMSAKDGAPELLFKISLICGLLGGSLSNIKFFIPTGSQVKTFNIGYVYKYLANPFFSSIISFLSFLAFMNMQWFGLEINGSTDTNILSLIFIFTVVGYFSEHFINILYAFVKKFSEWLEGSFSLELKKSRIEDKKLVA